MHKEKLATSKQQSLSSYFSHLGQKYRTENMVSGHLTLEHSILSSGVAAPTVADGEIFVGNPETPRPEPKRTRWSESLTLKSKP
jgi:hypothetical protein